MIAFHTLQLIQSKYCLKSREMERRVIETKYAHKGGFVGGNRVGVHCRRGRLMISGHVFGPEFFRWNRLKMTNDWQRTETETAR